MSTVAMNSLGLMRFGGFHGGGGGGVFGLLLGVVILGVVVWAIAGGANGESAKS